MAPRSRCMTLEVRETRERSGFIALKVFHYISGSFIVFMLTFFTYTFLAGSYTFLAGSYTFLAGSDLSRYM
jgi:hypothetical protein